MSDARKTFLKDQADAATAHAHRYFLGGAATFAALGNLDHIETDATVPLDLTIALLRRCRHCEHLVVVPFVPQLMFCSLELRAVACEHCLVFLTEEIRRRVEEGEMTQECDVCLQPVPSNRFVEFTIQQGFVLVFGNKGPCCDDLKNVVLS